MSEDKKGNNNGWVEIGKVVRDFKKQHALPILKVREAHGVFMRKSTVTADKPERKSLPVVSNNKTKTARAKGASYNLINLGRNAYKKKHGLFPDSSVELWNEIIELLPEKKIISDDSPRGERMIKWGDEYCVRSNFIRTYNRYFK